MPLRPALHAGQAALALKVVKSGGDAGRVKGTLKNLAEFASASQKFATLGDGTGDVVVQLPGVEQSDTSGSNVKACASTPVCAVRGYLATMCPSLASRSSAHELVGADGPGGASVGVRERPVQTSWMSSPLLNSFLFGVASLSGLGG